MTHKIIPCTLKIHSIEKFYSSMNPRSVFMSLNGIGFNVQAGLWGEVPKNRWGWRPWKWRQVKTFEEDVSDYLSRNEPPWKKASEKTNFGIRFLEKMSRSQSQEETCVLMQCDSNGKESWMGDKSTFRILNREANQDKWASKHQGVNAGGLAWIQNPKSGSMNWEPANDEKAGLKQHGVLVARMSLSYPPPQNVQVDRSFKCGERSSSDLDK